MHKENTNFGRGEQEVLKEINFVVVVSLGKKEEDLLRTFVSCPFMVLQPVARGITKGEIPVPTAGCPELSKIPFC